MKRSRSTLLRDLLMVLAWTAVAVLAGAVTWSAVSRLGGGAATSEGPLTSADVLQALRQAPAPAGGRSPAPSSAPDRPGGTTRTWRTVGGTVAASCRRGAVALVYAVPADGWAYQLDTARRRVLAVTFTRPGEAARLVARCSGRAPTHVVRVAQPAPASSPAPPGGDGGGEGSGD